jgi:RNA polymerase sigma-70 factor (ECF subfamily)
MSLAEVYVQHGDAVRALARRQLGNAVDADDIAAGTFSLLMTLEGPHTRGGRGPEVRAFVLGVCANLIRRFRRARARRAQVHTRYADEAPAAVDDLERTVACRELAARLSDALASLPEEQRMTLVLSAIGENSSADIARLTNVPEATVRTRLFHARRKLREALQPPSPLRRGRALGAACLVLLLGLLALGPRATAARLAEAWRAVLHTIGVDVGGGWPAGLNGLRDTTSPARAPVERVAGAAERSQPPMNIGSPSPPSHLPSLSPPAAIPQRRPSRAAPRSAAVDPLHLEYVRAHRAQFVAHDYAAALHAWDSYLSRAHAGSFELEARYNRAIALAQLGRVAEARDALSPFARGDFGAYRRRAAARLLEILSQSPPDSITP